MSVIQKIRDKYARISVIAIAVSLLGFILMDAFAGRTGMFNNGPSNTLGKVNGTTIQRLDFDKKTKEYENQYAAQGYPINDETRQQIQQSVWDEEVNTILMNREYEKLGLTITERELRELLYGANPPQFLSQAFTDPKTGKFNAVTAQQQVNQLLKSGSTEQKNYINQQIEFVKKQRLMAKYMAMLTNTINYPKWFIEKNNADNSLIGRVSYVSIPYASIPDSTVKISDDEIRDYMKKHEDEFEQKTETRSISYVSFSAAPSAADSAATRNSLLTLKAGFDSTQNPKQFVEANESAFPFYDSYISKNAMQQPNKDSILSAPVGVVYGPYLDGNQYVLSKIIGVKQYPDTVKARHILVSTHQRTETGLVQVRDDSTAKHLIDSVQGLLNKGENFDSLVVKFSDDQGSKDKGGVYENVTANGQMVPAFSEFIFEHKVGERGIVKTEFGYHLIEVLSQKGSSPAYKIAYVSKPIVASDETDQAAQNAANLFAGDSRDLKSFNDNWDKNLRSKGINKFPATDIAPMDYGIPGLPTSARSFIRKVFDAKNGEVIGPERVGDSYIVAIITEVNEPGLKSVGSVRPAIEPILRNKKKADQIIKRIGKVNSLEDVAAKEKQPVQLADSLRFTGGNSMLGFESRVLGAVFNPNNKGKVVPEAIEGSQGVYAVRVENISTVPVETANVEEQRKNFEMRAKQSMMGQMQQGVNPVVETLKRAAKIKDNRAEFY